MDRKPSQPKAGLHPALFCSRGTSCPGGPGRRHYFAGAQRIAVRRGDGEPLYIFGDHLGSASLMVDGSIGNTVTELRYKPWGEIRYNSGEPTTDYRYTGQQSFEASFGLYFYNARWYDARWDALRRRIRLCRGRSPPKPGIGLLM